MKGDTGRNAFGFVSRAKDAQLFCIDDERKASNVQPAAPRSGNDIELRTAYPISMFTGGKEYSPLLSYADEKKTTAAVGSAAERALQSDEVKRSVFLQPLTGGSPDDAKKLYEVTDESAIGHARIVLYDASDTDKHGSIVDGQKLLVEINDGTLSRFLYNGKNDDYVSGYDKADLVRKDDYQRAQWTVKRTTNGRFNLVSKHDNQPVTILTGSVKLTPIDYSFVGGTNRATVSRLGIGTNNEPLLFIPDLSVGVSLDGGSAAGQQ